MLAAGLGGYTPSARSHSHQQQQARHSSRHLGHTVLRWCPTFCEKLSIQAAAADTMHAPSTSTFIQIKSLALGNQERMDFLREDLTHLFDDRGIDQSQYDDVVQFRDPITSYNDAKGYMFNIGMLKRVFDPDFMLHDIRQTGEYEVTTRWTMQMKFTLTQNTPISRFWKPKLVFTGTSIMGINPENGKFNRHIDFWDSIENQEYFSFEAFQHVLAQLGSLQRVPENLPTPRYTILRKYKDFEVRRYEPFLVAETAMDGVQASTSGSSGGSEATSPAGRGDGAFNRLAGFIFGGNKSGARMAMTSPVLSDSRGRMQFVIEPTYKEAASVPAPVADGVEVREQPGGCYAAASFSGVADARASADVEAALRRSMQARELEADGPDWLLARYNDPSTKPMFRRNEVLIPVRGFQLW